MNTTTENIQSSRLTILIIEDHHAVRASLRAWFSATFPDCRCLEASSGEDAVALVVDQLPEIVLMDIGLPGMNGIEATRRIKTTAPQTQVVMLSIHEAPSYQADALAAGASAYVTKRKMNTELMSIVRALLARPRESRGPFSQPRPRLPAEE